MSDIEEFADGMALWEEHRPQTAEDWVAVAERCLATPPYPANPSPLFGALLIAVKRAQEAVGGAGGEPHSPEGE